MLHFISVRGVRAHKNVAHYKTGKMLYVIYRDRSRVVELLLQQQMKKQIMQNNIETYQ